jgi:hypothetical protein
VNGSPQKVDFTSCYRNLPQAFTDEVQEYFKLPHENFDTCDPLQWWAGQRSQFPNLSRFARDILSIPGKFTTDLFSLFNHLPMFLSFYAGSAVAVEHIFSGSRDTISLHHANLNPETIRTLMLVKQQLRLARTAVHDILGD